MALSKLVNLNFRPYCLFRMVSLSLFCVRERERFIELRLWGLCKSIYVREFLFGQNVGVKIRKGVRWGIEWGVVSSSNPGRGVTECWKEKK